MALVSLVYVEESNHWETNLYFHYLTPFKLLWLG